jgi:hypothetical protein
MFTPFRTRLSPHLLHLLLFALEVGLRFPHLGAGLLLWV